VTYSAAMDIASIDTLLTTTRAVRRRLDLDRPVDPNVVHQCLEIALQAPTGGNRQQWRWVVVTDPDKRKALADIYRKGAEPYLEARLAETTDEQSLRVHDSARYLLDVLHRVPVHVVPCHRGRITDSSNAAAAGFYGSILPAVWSLQLALRSRGLGSALTTLHLLHEAEAAELLGIPDDVTQVALLPVAHYTGEGFKPAARRPVEKVAYLDEWGTPFARE
jgi:nitroreductase